MQKKIRKSGSYLSMENLDIEEESEEDEQDETTPSKKKDHITNDTSLKLDSESIVLFPIYILEQAFSKVVAVGSSTAMVAIRN